MTRQPIDMLNKVPAATAIFWFISATQARGHGPTALDYLVQDGTGTRFMGEIPVQTNPKNGWVTSSLMSVPVWKRFTGVCA